MPTTTKLLLASSLLAATAASAQPSETAESAAKRGDVAMKAKNVHEACEAYEISEHQSASAETEDKLAKCDEQDGKPIAAARYYRMHAKQDTDAKRKKASLAKADKLEAKAPKLRFAVNPNPPGLVIKVDGTEVPITGDVMVDIGPHTVTASAPGFEGHASASVDRDKQVLDVILRMEATRPAEPPPAPPVTAKPPVTEPSVTEPAQVDAPAAVAPLPEPVQPAMTTSDHRKRNGLVVGAVGIGALAASGVLFATSQHQFNNEHTICPHSTCLSQGDADKANGQRDTARTERAFAIGAAAAGAVLVIGGIYLIATHEHIAAEPIALRVEHDGASMAWTGRF